MRLFGNFFRVYKGLYIAAQEPEVRSVVRLAIALILIATFFYWLVEGWSLLNSMYFSVVTIATLGYGDFAPQTAIGKIFTIFYVFGGSGYSSRR